MSLSYSIEDVRELASKIVFALLPGILLGLTVYLFSKEVSAVFALEYLSAIAQINATILSVFFGVFIVVIGLSKKEIISIMDKSDLIASFLCFFFSIVFSLINILNLPENTIINIGSVDGYLLIIVPIFWLIVGLTFVGMLVWNLYAKIIA